MHTWTTFLFLVALISTNWRSETVGFCVLAYDQHGVISIGKFLNRCSKIPMERNKNCEDSVQKRSRRKRPTPVRKYPYPKFLNLLSHEISSVDFPSSHPCSPLALSWCPCLRIALDFFFGTTEAHVPVNRTRDNHLVDEKNLLIASKASVAPALRTATTAAPTFRFNMRSLAMTRARPCRSAP